MIQPAISVVVPLYNKADYINATLESLLAQTHEDFQVLVVDNGSTDTGSQCVRDVASRDNRVQLSSSPKQGPGHARNFGVQNSTGRWIQFLDADDLLEPDHLANLIEIANRNPDATVIAGGWKEFVDGNPNDFVAKRPASEADPTEIANATIAASPWAVHAALVDRQLILDHPWPEHLDGLLAEDNAFWFGICLHGSVVFSSSASALYRTQTENCRTQSGDIQKWFDGVNAAAEENVKALRALGREPNPQQASALMRLYSGLYNQAIEANNTQYAKLAAEKANHWLSRCESSSGSLMLRKLIGIPLFEKTRRLIG
ncbi:glycosyltransferase family 2 protein [Rhodopirellula bahusiensis]|uniref:glycosyltransferase family 2 protein n=1 Tax=Rhodopirellula bahusiensis TaxID=2014065 RepID=UPI0013046E63|nr:glycosyltransferase family 2 protein [Rhodopirellula bahusiensis]